MPIEVLLLLALPAAGKSEIRAYLEHLDPSSLADLGLGPQAHLDDYPYVHSMRVVSRELRSRGRDPVFFADDSSPFLDGRDWLTLTALLDEDRASLAGEAVEGTLLDRLDRARETAGAGAVFASMPAALRAVLVESLGTEAPAPPPKAPPGSTIVAEFARGGPEGASLPLPHPLGYRASLGALSPEFLQRAAILYVWVTPEESRRRNRERARPGPEGDASILHHGVPEEVMLHDYGVDDLMWMLDRSPAPGTVAVDADGGRIDVPAAVFDNREDRTSFLRSPPPEWPAGRVAELHRSLEAAFTALRRR
jgi:hypothetical protein